jgi:ATP-binding cassette, subfamily B, bacterial PglK
MSTISIQVQIGQYSKDISFKIKVGETIGVIGSSGSGKTTFLNVFLRLLKESSGNIKVDGNIINETTNALFQKSIGYVQQAVYIKNGTLKENIAFGEMESEIDIQKLKRVLKDAMLEEFVINHPGGYDMLLGENGVMLSGGQRQRIGIARALYKDAEILLFDEATSALDPETEKAIVATIYNLTKLNKTIVIVAHRVTTLEMCDRIYDLKAGEIAGIYNYKEVLDKVMVK